VSVAPPLLRHEGASHPGVSAQDDHEGPDAASLPRLGEDQDSTLTAVTGHLEAQRGERLAQELDPGAAEVARLRRTAGVAAPGRVRHQMQLVLVNSR
jgi:hypothetical protein